MHRLAACVAVCLPCLAQIANAQPLNFTRDDYGSAAGARAIVTADFDRNGWPDVAQANGSRNSVTILLNSSDGIRLPLEVAAGTGPFDLVAADFNRDAQPDLAVANADGHSITVLLNDGGAFARRTDLPVPAQNPRGIAAADMNGDSRPDIIYTGYATGTVQVLLGDGAGGFSRGAAYVAAGSRPQGLVTADFDRDGIVDVAVANASGAGLRLLYGRPGGGFSARALAGAANVNLVAAADFNRDGWMDLAAVSTAAATLTLFLGTSTGLAPAAAVPTAASPRGLAVADVNQDGTADLAIASRAASTVSVFVGDRQQPRWLALQGEFAAGSGSRDVAAADFDGNGTIDLATANENAATTTLLYNATPFERAAYGFTRILDEAPDLDLSVAQNGVADDFNRDGRLDLVMVDQHPHAVSVLLTGGATVHLPAPGLTSFASGDVNRDGNPDILYSRAAESAVAGVYPGDGRGGFGQPRETTVSWAWGHTSFVTGDFNADGCLDVLLVDLDLPALGYAMEVLVGRGDGTFRRGSRTAVSQPAGLALADVNRDGTSDLLLTIHGDGLGRPARMQTWLGDGSGRFLLSPADVFFDGHWTTGSAAADVNRDGFADVVAATFTSLAVALGGASGFGQPTFLPAPAGAYGSVALGDLDLDGHIDAVLGSGHVFSGRGDGTFAAPERFDYGDADIVRLVDFTGDGLPDIIAAQRFGWTRVLANRRGAVNHDPAVNAGADRVFEYADLHQEDGPCYFEVEARDPDSHHLVYEWRDAAGTLLPYTERWLNCNDLDPGIHPFTVLVRDGRGGSAHDSVVVSINKVDEIVLWTADGYIGPQGPWTLPEDPTAAGGLRAHAPDLGVPKRPPPDPAGGDASGGAVVLTFVADPNRTYKLWVRLRADRNSWANDSVWVQFARATDVAGVPVYRTGTPSALAVNLEECSGCGISGWGWEDDGWGAAGANGTLLRFPKDPDRGAHAMFVYVREDGVSIDQIVLSADKYVTTRPGRARDDATILPATQPPWRVR